MTTLPAFLLELSGGECFETPDDKACRIGLALEAERDRLQRIAGSLSPRRLSEIEESAGAIMQLAHEARNV